MSSLRYRPAVEQEEFLPLWQQFGPLNMKNQFCLTMQVLIYSLCKSWIYTCILHRSINRLDFRCSFLPSTSIQQGVLQTCKPASLHDALATIFSHHKHHQHLVVSFLIPSPRSVLFSPWKFGTLNFWDAGQDLGAGARTKERKPISPPKQTSSSHSTLGLAKNTASDKVHKKCQ